MTNTTFFISIALFGILIASFYISRLIHLYKI